MEVMEVREALEEAASDPEVEVINEENKQKILETCQALSSAFEENDFDLAKDLTIQLQYWDNIRRAIVDWVPGKRVEVKH
ncbi:hypothetical protein DM01DRAFT_254543 [Hesseltinella vesiculosa]|uniref:Co-chaperone HscB C-terminal oligomerisation domain-containing protein n=1 Tax=Hesseltinella vesiculosa TaxID=101127 RepID=A0A1X2GFJ6_9FUNG|nr:hypothetical protein DM01DRAFT_254543 [Hesseltinella vesiculosa]